MSDAKQNALLIRLGPEHAAAAAALETSCFSSVWQEDQWRTSLKLPHFIAYGMQRQACLLAYILLAHAQEELEIINLATRAEERRQGHARRLLETALALMEPLGAKSILLEVDMGNVAARTLYDSLGFKRVGVRKAYYRDTGEDALLMSRPAGKG